MSLPLTARRSRTGLVVGLTRGLLLLGAAPRLGQRFFVGMLASLANDDGLPPKARRSLFPIFRVTVKGPRRLAFTLIELLVVIGITGVVAGLLLAAVQKVREASNRAKCADNLRQIGLACLHHESVYGRFPTGGWGWSWVGDPDRGTDQKQPGGWIFNILPFVEQDALYRLGSGLTGDKKLEANSQRIGTPLPLFNCPSRRTDGPYPNALDLDYFNAKNPVPLLARSDYAANTGDQPIDQFGPGPLSLQEGDDPRYSGWHDTSALTGIVFERSRIRVADITNGTSNTYLAGE